VEEACAVAEAGVEKRGLDSMDSCSPVCEVALKSGTVFALVSAGMQHVPQ
jgi:hypothetical protein